MLEKQIAEQKDVDKGHTPRILFYDLEISPMLAWVYQAYDANTIKTEQAPKIISFAYQWSDEKTIHCKVLSDYKGYKPDRFNIDDKQVTVDLYNVMSEADLLIGHNSDNFDFKIANARFAYYGLDPLPNQRYYDTLKKARQLFKMPKNNLDEIYFYYFEEEGKTKIKHSDILWDYLAGDKKAHEHMRAYNKRDIEITRAIYEKMSPFDKRHPNLTLLQRDGSRCKVCLSDKLERKPQSWYLRSVKRQRFKCLDCGHNNYIGRLKDLEVTDNY